MEIWRNEIAYAGEFASKKRYAGAIGFPSDAE
jgi:hypothetical protein